VVDLHRTYTPQCLIHKPDSVRGVGSVCSVGKNYILAKAVVEDLEERGVALWTTLEGKLRFSPKRIVEEGEGDIETLKRLKPEIVAVLSDRIGKVKRPTPPTLHTPAPTKADTYGESSGVCTQGETYTKSGETYTDPPDPTLPSSIVRIRERRQAEAERLGLIATFSQEYGYIALHDPTSGEWHDVAMKDAPQWAKNEAFKRRDLKR
jgi:hypothetical protein